MMKYSRYRAIVTSLANLCSTVRSRRFFDQRYSGPAADACLIPDPVAKVRERKRVTWILKSPPIAPDGERYLKYMSSEGGTLKIGYRVRSSEEDDPNQIVVEFLPEWEHAQPEDVVRYIRDRIVAEMERRYPDEILLEELL